MKSDHITLLQNAAWPVFLVDANCRICSVNQQAAAVFGAVVQGEGPRLMSIWSGENKTRADEFIAGLGRNLMPQTQIFFNIKGGQSQTFQVSISPFSDGQRYYLFQLANNLPPKGPVNPLVETSLLQKQKLDCALQMARSVALDFNNALTIILGHASLMRSKMAESDPWRHSLMEMEKSAERAAEIAADLAAFSRQEKETRQHAASNLNVLLRQTCDMFHSLPGVMQWEVHLEPRLYATHLDEAKVQQALTKVVENAVEALNPEGGVVQVVSRNADLGEGNEEKLTPGHYVAVEISDNGYGIPPETLARIFEPFFTTKVGHRGLGLAWVYGIITNHGGTVRAESEAGSGTRFKIFLPASKRQLPDNSCKEDELHGNQTVLLVDDEELVLTLGKTVLSSYGYQVLTAGSGASALKVFHENARPIDLLITDMVMPQMSGRELIEAVQKKSPATKVLTCSGYVQASQSDDELYLKKPFTSQQMLLKVKQVLG